MKMISINVRVMGEYGKKDWIRSIIKDERPDVIGLQETKCGVVDDLWIEDIWGGQGYGYSQLPANGNSGGIIVIWDTRIFVCNEAVEDERFIMVKGSWKGKNGEVNIKEMMEFNEFINNTRLIEISMGGRKFARISDDGMKFSKLDRFLLNDKFNELWGNLSIVALDRKLSDHCPIVIKDVELDFGPKPFKVFNIWLKNVKASLRAWSKDRFGGHKVKVEELRKEAMRWELEAEKRALNENEIKIKKISTEEALKLEKEFSEKEVWEAFYGCEGDKAPGPDGFNFKFIKKSWKIDIVWGGMEIDGMGLEFSSFCLGVLGGRMVVYGIRGHGLTMCGVGNGNGDKWRWVLSEDGDFTVKELARLVEDKILHLESGGHETLWNKLVLKKVNIFIWRAIKGRILVRLEIDRRGIDLDSVLCPCCNNVLETCAHSLVTCDLARSVWDKIFDWWKVGGVNAFSIEEFFSSNGGANVPTILSCVWQADLQCKWLHIAVMTLVAAFISSVHLSTPC
ncbi:RNA-directed DNA polymerase, eukaryota, reverse transcriptase zinc-binding domain protein [Tanacetum coccineum]|uniref:RNA-directed DNA polymerase, eukaryota, reverse transcriptase zinc-binding domain protein n=1 Tax=Tanacetum coccineum TaxID=301880 RepID=A0ABQ5CQI4_9ASTR